MHGGHRRRGACWALALVPARPSTAGDASVLDGTRDIRRAANVRIDDAVHLVLNLASARLIVGGPANLVVVNDAAIAKFRRGLGGRDTGCPCPDRQSARASTSPAQGRLRDVAGSPLRPVLLAGSRVDGELSPLPRQAGAAGVRRARWGRRTYLLADGWRARVDLRDIAVVRALHLEGISAQPVSRKRLLDSVPEGSALQALLIAEAWGHRGPAELLRPGGGHRDSRGALPSRRVLRGACRRATTHRPGGGRRHPVQRAPGT